jgi:polysaccharide deacetylase family protein (PEP-CTERM system associated)
MWTEPVSPIPPADMDSPLHAFTVDVEDWYQSCWDYDAPITGRVVRNVHTILELLQDAGTRGTFFVQGLVAETFPGLVQTMVSEGHEVQSHGYSHRPLSRMNRSALRDELERAKKTVEDAAGVPVTAFRAQDFTVLSGNLWALEAIATAGFTIDSSVFPMRSARYGVSGWPLGPHHVLTNGGARLLEVPVAVWSRGAVRFPVAGGGYLRMLPEPLVARALRSIGACRPAIVYCHPYEFAPDELAGYPTLPWRLRTSQGVGRGSFRRRVARLLRDLRFGSLEDVLEAWAIG